MDIHIHGNPVSVRLDTREWKGMRKAGKSSGDHCSGRAVHEDPRALGRPPAALFYPPTCLGRSAKLPNGLHILPSVISSFFIWSKAISVSTGPIFTIFSPNKRHLREFSWSGPFFQIPQGMLPWQPILCRKQNTKPIFAILRPYESLLGVDDGSEFFFNISRDVAMTTNFVAKLWQNYLLHLLLCYSETEWDNALQICAFIAPLIALHRVKWWKSVQ